MGLSLKNKYLQQFLVKLQLFQSATWIDWVNLKSILGKTPSVWTEVRQKNAFLYAKNAWHCSQPNQLTSGHRSLCHIFNKKALRSVFFVDLHIISSSIRQYINLPTRCNLVHFGSYHDFWCTFLVLVLWTLIAMCKPTYWKFFIPT